MSTINVEKHETGAFFKEESVTSLNICKLKNGNTAIGINNGDSSLVFEFNDDIKAHLVNLLNLTPANHRRHRSVGKNEPAVWRRVHLLVIP